MATVLTLEKSSDKSALRLVLAGSRLVTHVKPGPSSVPCFELMAAGSAGTHVEPWGRPILQCFQSVEAAREHLDSVVRLRGREGYTLRETNEIADDEAAQLADEVADPLVRSLTHLRERWLMVIRFDRGPVSPEACVEIVARVAQAAPSCVDYVRRDDVPGGRLGAALAGQALPSVISLIHTVNPNVNRHPVEALDDLAELLAALPNLERLFAVGKFALSRLRHGSLRELYLRGEPHSPETLRGGLATGSLPALATLGLSVSDSPKLARAAATALKNVRAPRLRAILVTGIPDVTRFLAMLTRGPIPESWATLHLQGIIGDEDKLLALLRLPALRSLKVLGLPLADHVSQGAAAEATALLPSIVDTSEGPDLLSQELFAGW